MGGSRRGDVPAGVRRRRGRRGVGAEMARACLRAARSGSAAHRRVRRGADGSVDVTTHYLLYLYAESPVHTGAADSIDVLDLPVQREAATGYPVIWGQSLKGALRQAATDAGWGTALTEVFGSAIERSDEDGGTTDGQRDTTPGTLAVGDAQLVAMPVPTLRHTFGWLTSAIALARLA